MLPVCVGQAVQFLPFDAIGVFVKVHLYPLSCFIATRIDSWD
jgi:hypothetical protein